MLGPHLIYADETFHASVAIFFYEESTGHCCLKKLEACSCISILPSNRITFSRSESLQ